MIISIDPGKQGAVAREHKGAVEVHDTPVIKVKGKNLYDERGMRALLIKLWMIQPAGGPPPTVVIETSNAHPGQAIMATWAQAMGIALWIGIVVGLDWPYQLVYPQKWHKSIWSGFTKLEPKLASYRAAAQIYPQLADQLTGPKGGLKDGRCDALCILEWARREIAR